jgi:hypothetical protein
VLAAAAVAVIDFVSNFMLGRLRRRAGPLAGRIRAMAQRIGQRLRRITQGIARKARQLGQRIRGGVQGLQARFQRRRRRRPDTAADRHRRQSERDRKRYERQQRAFRQVRQILQRRLSRPVGEWRFRLLLRLLKLRYRFQRLDVIESGQRFRIEAGFSPGEPVFEGEMLRSGQDGGGSGSILTWVNDEVEGVIASGGIRGGIAFRRQIGPRGETLYVHRVVIAGQETVIKSKDRQDWHGHHPWPEYMGGPEKQPLMAVKNAVHISLIHPMLYRFMAKLYPTHHITNTEVDDDFRNRLINDSRFRRSVANNLKLFHTTLPASMPPIPPAAYTRGIDHGFNNLGRRT